MFKPLIYLFSAFFFSFSANAAAPAIALERNDIKSFSVVAPSWEGFTNADGSGLYWELLKAIYTPEQIDVKIANVPWNRAIQMVTKYRVYNAIVGETQEGQTDLSFPAYAIDVEYQSVLSMSSRKLPWNGLHSLSGKKVGWIKDYDLIEKAERNFELIEYRTTEQGLEMLEAGKIDYLIDEWDEISKVVSGKGQDMTRYVMNEMPVGTDVYVAFANSPAAPTLVNIYNERIKALYAEGKLQALYEKWNAEIPESVREALSR